MTTIQEITQLERHRFDAQIARDTSALAAIFADDLIYTHSNGQRDDKATYLASIVSGQSRYDAVDLEDLTVRPYNDDRAAVVNGTVRIDVGGGVWIRIKYAVVYIKNDVAWQLVLWHAQKQA